MKLRAEQDDLKLKSEKEYNQEVMLYTKELDTVRVKNQKDLEELRRYNLNEEKKFVTNAKESNLKELKRYVLELENEYKRGKEEMKKELAAMSSSKSSSSSVTLTSKQKEEKYKSAKIRLHNDCKIKEENKRKQLDMSSTQELCLLQRKHMIIMHRKENDLLLNEMTEQKNGLSRNHKLLANHLQAVYALKQRHLFALQK